MFNPQPKDGGFLFGLYIYGHMKKIIRLTESELIGIVGKLLNEGEDLIYKLIEPYKESGAVTVKYVGSYFVVDVESPGYFEHYGFDSNDGLRIKAFLRKNGYISFGVGEYAKKLN